MIKRYSVKENFYIDMSLDYRLIFYNSIKHRKYIIFE